MGVKLASSGGGSVQINAASTVSSFTATLPAATGTVVLDSAAQTLTNKSWSSPAGSTVSSGTAVASTSGTSIDFTGIPSWAKRITVMFQGVSASGTSFPLVQLGTSGGVVVTGYTGSVIGVTDANAIAGSNFTTGFSIRTNVSAAASFSGAFVFTNITGNTWVLSGSISDTSDIRISVSNGFIALSGTLDRVRITTVNGTDTFDAGSINILYE